MVEYDPVSETDVPSVPNAQACINSTYANSLGLDGTVKIVARVLSRPVSNPLAVSAIDASSRPMARVPRLSTP